MNEPPTEWQDWLVLIWRRLASGQREEASALLMHYWSGRIDALSEPREGRMALRLFDRLSFSTDDLDDWASPADPLKVVRIGDAGGVSWTTSQEVVAIELERMPDGPVAVLTATIRKSDALAFISGYGESEVICRPPGPQPESISYRG